MDGMMIDGSGLELLALLPLVLAFVWAPKTWIPGELVSASAMNTNIRDHLNEGLRVQTSSLTGSQNDFALDGPFAYVKWTNSSATEVTGVLLDGGNIDGARIYFEAGDRSVTIMNENASSTAANRFITDTGLDIVLAQGERAFIVYDTASLRWRAGKISTGALVQAVGAINFFPDSDFIMWPLGDDKAPAGSVLTQDGNSVIDRNTTIPYVGESGNAMCAELKLGNTATVTSKLTYSIFSALPVGVDTLTFVSVGMACRAAVANLARYAVDDGGTGGRTETIFHPGNDEWLWTTLVHKFSGNATKLDLILEADIGGKGAGLVSALFDGITMIAGPVAPPHYVQSIYKEGSLNYSVVNEVATATNKFRHKFKRAALIRNTSLRAETVNTGAALIADVNHYDGTTHQSMYSTRPQIAAGASTKSGGADPDATTYRYRCFAGAKNAEADDDALLTVDIDQVGSTVKGSDLDIQISVLQFQDPYAALKAF